MEEEQEKAKVIQEKKVSTIKDSEIFIGQKPFGVYIKAVRTLFGTKKFSEIAIKARGKNISKAVDVVEASRNKFCKDLDLKLGEIIINSEEFEKEPGKKVTVSSISISLKK